MLQRVDSSRDSLQATGPRRARPRCFTLVELIVVIVITAVLAAVGMGIYSSSAVHHQLEAAAKRIEADLALARQRAITTGTPQAVQGLSSTGLYTLPGIPDLDRPGSDYTVDLGAPPYELTMVSAFLGGDDEIIFDAYGKPDSSASVVIAVGSQQITLLVDSDTGQVSRQ